MATSWDYIKYKVSLLFQIRIYNIWGLYYIGYKFINTCFVFFKLVQNILPQWFISPNLNQKMRLQTFESACALIIISDCLNYNDPKPAKHPIYYRLMLNFNFAYIF